MGVLLFAAASCTWSAAGSTGCVPASSGAALPPGLEEASGAAPSAHDPSLVWTHGDSGDDPVLVAVDGEARTMATLRPAGARRVDWEALERAGCPDGSCLWIADTGDNQERRADAALHRIVEPEIPETRRPGSISVPSLTFPVRFPDGPRDVEALFVLPEEDVYLVSKGRNDPVTVYRYPPPLRPGERVTVEAVQELSEGPVVLPRQVTGAAASPGGRAVVVRTYQTLTFYRVRDRARQTSSRSERSPGPGDAPTPGRQRPLLEPLPGGAVDLTTLREAQGEGVAWMADGRIALASEAGPGGRRGGLRVLRCPVADRP